MSFWQALFHTKSRPNKPYVDSGMELTSHLIVSLALPGWSRFRPEYDEEERRAISGQLEMWQRMADDVAGGKVAFHPEVLPEITRRVTSEALVGLAAQGWQFTVDTPVDWKIRSSRYLKAWASSLDPEALSQLAELLARAGYKTEAKRALTVLLQFQAYAPQYFGGDPRSATLAAAIVSDARNRMTEW